MSRRTIVYGGNVMKVVKPERHKAKYLRPLAGLALLAGSVLAAAPGVAATDCSVAGIAGLNIANLMTDSTLTVTAVPASPSNPVAFCDVKGFIRTTGEGAPDGAAGFEVRLPENWKGKFLFLGVGGFAGRLSPSVNPTDFVEALPKGYATTITDTGH